VLFLRKNMKVVIFLVVFLLAGAFMVISNNNFHIGNSAEFNSFMKSYYGWFFKIFENTKTVTGAVINMNWLP